MKKGIAIFILLMNLQAWAQEPAGEVADFVGEVWITSSGQTPSRPSLKQPIFVGDVLETKKKGAVKILFKDDTLLTIKENSKTMITEYLFDPKAKKRRAIFNVSFGTIRTVVGRFFGKDEVVEIKTPTAVAGIRGTDVGAFVTKKKTTFYCFSGMFEAFNISMPEQPIEVMAGTFTDIQQSAMPTPVAPTPDMIENQKEMIFDIPLSQQPEAKPQAAAEAAASSTQSAGTQVVQSARQEVTTQTSSTTTIPTAVQTPTETVLSVVATTSQTEQFTTNTNPASTTTQGLEPVPGGGATATNPATITITLP